MKVIKTQNPEEWSLKINCTECDSELEGCSKDIIYKYINGDFRDPGYDSYAVQCPVCDNVINLLCDELPKTVQLFAKRAGNIIYYDLCGKF